MPVGERIAIVTTSYPASEGDPSGHFVATQAHSLSRAGNAVTVFTGGAAAPGANDARNPSVVRVRDGGATGWPGLVARLRERPTRAFGLGAWGIGVRRELTRRGPFQRVIGHFLLPTGFPVLFGVELGGAELELVVHGSDARLLERLPRALGRRILRATCRAARVRCVSHELFDLLRRVAGESISDKLYVEPLPLDISTAPTRAVGRAELGIAESVRLVVIVSRLIPEKRTGAALAAAALVPGARVVVIGDGPELATLAEDYPQASFLGRLSRPQTLTWLGAADVLLSASRLEGAPSAVREARALGVPVVTCAAGDLARWAESDGGLWVVS